MAGLVAVALGSVAAAEKAYGPGVSDTEIKIGNTNPYSGPAAAYSTIGRVMDAYFRKANAEGGINGRSITFISVDDEYNPSRTVLEVRKLVEHHHVLLLFQPLGTPTNSAVREYLNEKGVPQLFVSSGAGKWADPDRYPWTMGFQPDYETEGAVFARYILETVKEPRIGVLFQNDDYGRDYLKGLRRGLGARAATAIVSELSYEVTDPTVSSQIIRLKASGANVFVNIATAKAAAQAIRKVKELGWQPLHVLNSVSNSTGAVLDPAGRENAIGIVSAAYLKDPQDPRWHDDPGYRAWRSFMERYYPQGDPADGLNVYGYTAAQLMVHVLKMAGDRLTRAHVMEQAASLQNLSLPMLLPGITVSTSKRDYRPIEQIQLVRFDGRSWVPFGEVVGVASASDGAR